jgi:8-oxo-dGTP pyrophosphatase MutT (NUDIX family)
MIIILLIITIEVFMDKYIFIACEDLVYTVTQQDSTYDLPEAPFDIPFKTNHIRTNKIVCTGKTYEVELHIAGIEFPGVTLNWKRRRELMVSRNISHILAECLYNVVPSVRSAVFPVFDNDKIVLVKPVYFDYFEIPGGSIDYMGNLEEGAMREAKEEANIEVQIERYIRSRSYILEHLSPHLRINPQWFISVEFLGKVIGGVPKANNEIEMVAVERITDITKGRSRIPVKDDLISGLKMILNYIK